MCREAVVTLSCAEHSSKDGEVEEAAEVLASVGLGFESALAHSVTSYK